MWIEAPTLDRYVRQDEEEAGPSRLCIGSEERSEITEQTGKVEALKRNSNFELSGYVSCAARGEFSNRVGLDKAKTSLLGLSKQPKNFYMKGIDSEGLTRSSSTFF